MAWQQWNTGTPILPSLTGIVNPAPVVNPINPTGVLPPQYTADQWAQMQQQNWQQWAQWQQQYQQWHQQYGAEYQKSMSALSQALQPPSMLNTSVPPPLPPEVKQPQPPSEPPKDERNFGVNFSAPPPNFPTPSQNKTPQNQFQNSPGNFNFNRNNNNQNSRNFGGFQQNRNNQNKPPSLMSLPLKKPDFGKEIEPKRMKMDINVDSGSTKVDTKLESDSLSGSQNPDELSETEKKFIKQFTEWEAQFNKWKEQNMNHPDKEQYKEYEKKWEAWRTQLLERREQMRRKRLGLLDNQKQVDTNTHSQQNQQKFVDKQPSIPEMNPEIKDDGSMFLKFNSSDGIPGLDLVGDLQDKEEPPPKNSGVIELDKSPDHRISSGPDLEAISKGINSILGDQKLLSMLSMVSQNQKIPQTSSFIDSTSKIQDSKGSEKEFNETSSQGGWSTQGDQRNFDNASNIDDQSRSSFGGKPDQDWGNKGFDRDFEGSGNNFRKGGAFRGRNQENYRDNESFTSNKDQFQPNKDQFQPNKDHFRPKQDRIHPNQDNFGTNQDRVHPNQDNFHPNQDRIHPNQDNFRPNQDRIHPNQDNFRPNQHRYEPNQDRFHPNQDQIPPNQDRFQPNQDRFQPNQDRFRRNQDNFGPNQDNFDPNQRFPPNQDRFDSKQDRFNPSEDNFNSNQSQIRPNQRFGPNQDRFHPNRDQFHPNQRFQPNQDRFDSNQDNFHPNQDNFHPNRDNFHPNQDNFDPNQDNFHPNQDNFDPNQDNFHPNQDNFHPNQENFHPNKERFHPNQDQFHPNQDNFHPNRDRFGPNQNNFPPNNDFRSQNTFPPNDNFREPNNLRNNFRNQSNFPPRGNNNFPEEGNPQNDFQRRDNFPPRDNFNNQNTFNQGNFDEDQFEDQPEEFGQRRNNNLNRRPKNLQNQRQFGRNFQNQPANENFDNFEYNYEENYEPEASNEEVPAETPKIEPPMWEPVNVIDYNHKTNTPEDIRITIEPLRTFDYRHKPVNRIPLPQRPDWLKKTLRNCREFDFVIQRYDQPTYSRYPPGYDRYGDSWRREERRRGDDYHLGNKRDDGTLKTKFEEGESKFEGISRSKFEEPNRNKFEETFGGRFEPPQRSFEDREKLRLEEEKIRFVDSDKLRFEEPERIRYSGDQDKMRFEEPERIKFGRFGDSQTGDESFHKESRFDNRSKDVGFRDIKDMKISPPRGSVIKNITLIEDILSPPGRYSRPARIVIILRGPPGSGKTFLAKLIKDKEVENGGSAPRILSLDDYFMIEQEKIVEEDGKKTKVKVMEYEYDASMEMVYRNSLFKAFKKTITDGYFPFIIVDNINDKVKYFGEMWSFAKQNGFQVYVCQLEFDLASCTKRNVHNRSESEIQKLISNWEPTPAHHPSLNATSLVQSASIPEVEMEEINSPPSEDFEEESAEEKACGSKWDNFDCSIGNLAKLDGTSKPLRTSRTMEDYLQIDDEWTSRESKPGQKRVRWADLEERKEQQKMRAIGFVVGQTNWDRMMDPTMGSSALTQTKYIERVPRFYRD